LTVDSIHEHHSYTNDTILTHVQGDHSPDTFKFPDISRLFTTFMNPQQIRDTMDSEITGIEYLIIHWII